MEGQFAYRLCSRIISIMEIVCLSLCSLLLVIACPFIIFMMKDAYDEEEDGSGSGSGSGEEGTDSDEVLTYDGFFGKTMAHSALTLWIEFVLLTLVVILSMVAAVKLFNATKIDADPREALGQAGFWRTVSIGLTVTGVIWAALTFSWMELIFSVLINAAFIFVVWKYINELENYLAFSPMKV